MPRSPKATPPLLWPDPHDGPWQVTLTWQVIDGRAECVGVEVKSYATRNLADVDMIAAQERTGATPRPVTASMLRTVPIGRLIEQERARTREWLGQMSARSKSKNYQAAAQGFAAEADEWRRPGRRPRHDPAQVAEVYTRAWRDSSRGGAPTRAVAEHLGISPSAAAKQVARARSLGLLPPTQRGRPQGGINKQEDR